MSVAPGPLPGQVSLVSLVTISERILTKSLSSILCLGLFSSVSMSVQTQHFSQVLHAFFTIEHVPWPFQVESLPGHAVNDEALEELTVSFARPWGADLPEWLRREKEKNPPRKFRV